MTMREEFVVGFGEEQAVAIETAAEAHRGEVGRRNVGSDAFRNALHVCIGFECMSHGSYRAHHGITAPWDALQRFMVARRDAFIAEDGDRDLMGLAAGAFDFLMPRPDTGPEAVVAGLSETLMILESRAKATDA